ncbi:MAG: hypothetical protein Q4G19_00050 [Clostridia bacterium]|nr:hypothetical protein [Clostridia bacterium]
MKKVLCLMAALLMVLCCTAANAAEVTALASEVNPENIALKIIRARITGYDEAAGTVTLVLLDNETFAENDIMNLRPGDTIFSDGETITVDKITFDLPCVEINIGEDTAEDNGVILLQNNDGSFNSYVMDYPITREMAEITVKLPEAALFLDGVEPEYGDPLDTPTVHTAAEFIQMLQASIAGGGALDFAGGNVQVTFNDKSEPMIIERYYTPWQ